jgi:hypothetical protein
VTAQVSSLDSALDYLGLGWSVLPLVPGEKRPVMPWQALQHEHPRREDVETWFRDCPTCNVGVVTGGVSGLVVLDVDPEHGGSESLTRLERRHGPLPPTVEAATGGGGRHLYFAHPGGLMRNRAAVVPGIDLRGDGGYVVAPPSLHPSGRRYQWRQGHEPGTLKPAVLPEWLLTMLRGRPDQPGHPLAHWRTLVAEGVAEGERNTTIASLAGHLLWHGVDPVVVLDLLLSWNARRCRPPLSEDEVARTVESITRLHQRQGEEGDDRSGPGE